MSASTAPIQNGNAVTAAATAPTANASGKPTAAPTEEEAPLCIGQQQIHEKIVSLGFSNAKVFVSNVDSQASAAGGIIIQVLGDISNDGGAWRKFVQTFFLAEQPNGYFVLNDIFRYLKEDEEVEEEAQDIDDAITEEVQNAAAKGVDVVHQAELTPGVTAPSAAAITAAQTAATSISTAPLDTVEEAQAVGDLKLQDPTPAAPSEVGVDKKVTTVERDEAPATRGQIEANQSSASAANPKASTPALNGANSNAAPSISPAVAAAAAAPAAPKTWANLAASNATKWGSTVNSESRGISSARENSNQQAQQSSRPSNNNNNNTARQTGHVFIKNVIVENLPSEGLQAALEAKFGPMKECTVNAAKQVAFGEFASVDSARKAIRASLPTSQGGEGGVKVGKDGSAVIIEEKRKPANANASGNASGTSRGARGGSSGQGAARGGRGTGRGGVAGGRGGGRTAA
ncbi:hypothetical protein L7F22_038888 [Adiantum nelumboides]|nr:hypothetical protein [Adiantum nelumboides]